MSTATIRRDCGEEIQNLLRNARTMDDDKLVSGMCNPGARLHHGELEMPVTGVGQVYHEDATTGINNFTPVQYDVTVAGGWYPTGEGNIHQAVAILIGQATATTPDPVFIPIVNVMDEIYGFRIAATALAAAREVDIVVTDGTDVVPIYQSGAANWVSGADFLVWPVDISTYMTGGVAVIGQPPLPTTNGQYIGLDTTGLAAAEAMTLYAIRVRKYINPLE